MLKKLHESKQFEEICTFQITEGGVFEKGKILKTFSLTF